MMLSIFKYFSLFLFFNFITIHSGISQSYFVDYESGNDNNSGLSQSDPWKHCPGDKAATGNPAVTTLIAGNEVFFKGSSSYRGSITMTASGTEQEKIKFIGNAWGAEKAIVDGGRLLVDWMDEGNGVYSTSIPGDVSFNLAGSFNLHQSVTGINQSLHVTQFPQTDDPFFYDDVTNYEVVENEDISLVSLTSEGFFNQTDPDYWKGSSVLIFVNPNIVEERKVNSFNPETNTIYFDGLPPNSIYPDGRDHAFAIYNSKSYLDQDGSYYIDFESSKIYVNPYSDDLNADPIGLSIETIGFNLNDKSHIEISGFEIKHFGGDIFIDAIGIGKSSLTHVPSTGITLSDNIIHDNRNGSKGNGGIYLPNCSDIIIKDNLIQNNIRSAGIFTSIGSNVLIESNQIIKCGSTNIRLYVVSNATVIHNKIYEAKGRHANGFTAYLGCYDVLFASNEIYDAITPVTFQNSGNLYFHNNIIDSRTSAGGISEWGRTSNENCTNGEILITNNTIITEENKIAIAVEKSLATTQQGSQSVGPNEYFSYNNIIDAGGLILSKDNTDYNLYTSLSWQQVAPWEPNTNEIIGDRNFDDYFTEYGLDYQLLESSEAANAGRNMLDELPIEKFPRYDFTVDVYGNARGVNVWSIGAATAAISNLNSNVSTKEELKVYPNPSNGPFTLVSPDSSKMEAVRIYNSEGRLVHTEVLECHEARLRPQLRSGLYMLVVQYADRSELGKKLIQVN